MCKLHLLVTGTYPIPGKVLRATASEVLNPADREMPDTLTLKLSHSTQRPTEIITSCLHTATWRKAGYTMNRLHILPC